MDARFIKAATVLPHQNKVCGRTLRPFCLRHRVALEAINSPFLNPVECRFDPLDVVMAAKILSTHDKEKMAEGLSVLDKWHIFRMSISRKYFSRSIGRILGCIQASLSYPKFWEKEKTKHERYQSIPYPLACVASLCRNGVDVETAWTMPEGEAVWMSVANAIYEGAKIDVISTDEEKDLENFNERIAAYKKANKLS